MGEMGTSLAEMTVSETETRRKKIRRFMFFVENRLADVDRLISQGEDPSTPEEEDHLSAFLRRAIEKHRELMDAFDLDATPIDEALWLALRGQWEFDGITESMFSD